MGRTTQGGGYLGYNQQTRLIKINSSYRILPALIRSCLNMTDKELKGWKKLLEGYPWFNCEGCYPLPAYSEFMPSPLVGRKPLGKTDPEILCEDDPFGWIISELEEEYELRPGILRTGHQIMNNIIKLGKGQTEHHIRGHEGQNLKDNPYWPEDLAARAGNLAHERFVTLLPMMLSRTQDDKGRVTWTFFGNSIHEPEQTFWKSFYSFPDVELPSSNFMGFFARVLKYAYGEEIAERKSLYDARFRILPISDESVIPMVAKDFLLNDSSRFDTVKYLLTFRPFSLLPGSVKERYFSGRLFLLPFPGSLVFWGMQNYNKLKKDLPVAGQIPLLNLVSRNQGIIEGIRVPQSGWFHEPHPDNIKHEINEELITDSFHRTHRWEKLHRYQDELNQAVQKVKIAKALFSTDADALDLYDKPLARNCQLWNHDFDLLLNGPKADRKKIYDAEKIILQGGLFGYRFFYPPMKMGFHSIYWHRPLVAYLPAGSDNAEILTDALTGYIAGYHDNDLKMESPVELWPRIQRREIFLSALRDFTNEHDYYSHQTSKNLLSLFDGYHKQREKPLSRSLAHKLLNLSKYKTLEQWLDEISLHTLNQDAASRMKAYLEKIIESENPPALPEPLTYQDTATRSFEEKWWNDIKFLAHGEYIYKDNADIVTDEATQNVVKGKRDRDLEKLGDYFIKQYRNAISEAGMEGIALCGELPFKWQTDFDYSLFDGWAGNQRGSHHERNILVVIPGRNRRQAVVLGDHYDTAYMEDIYEKGRGGSGARLAARGADDNHSASATLLQAAPIFLRMAREGKLERDIWLIHLTGEEFPADCMGARNFCRTLVEKNIKLKLAGRNEIDLSDTEIVGVYIMDMIGHNRDSDHNIFQISPGKSAASFNLAREAHMANMIWNNKVTEWNRSHERVHLGTGKRISGTQEIPDPAKHLAVDGEVRTEYNPFSSLFNTDGQIFSDMGVPVVLFMENYDINRSGYHDTKDTMENIDLDYGSALAAIAIETVARMASLNRTGL